MRKDGRGRRRLRRDGKGRKNAEGQDGRGTADGSGGGENINVVHCGGLAGDESAGLFMM